jgi:hypothetical protein
LISKIDSVTVSEIMIVIVFYKIFTFYTVLIGSGIKYNIIHLRQFLHKTSTLLIFVKNESAVMKLCKAY